jgi:hypothetical protein
MQHSDASLRQGTVPRRVGDWPHELANPPID